MPYSKIAVHHQTSVPTVKTIVTNFEENRQIGRRKGVWSNRVTVYEVRCVIDESLKRNPFLKAKELQEIIYQKTGKSVNNKMMISYI